MLQSQKVFVVDDASAVRQGPGRHRQEGPRRPRSSATDTIQTGQTDFSATVTKIRDSGADAVFFGGYYAEAGLLVKQMRGGGVDATVRRRRRRKDPGFIEAAGDAAEGTIITCPCLPPEESQDFADAYEEEFNAEPATYSAEAYDAANVFLAGHQDGNTDRESLLEWVNDYEGDGVTKTDRVRRDR